MKKNLSKILTLVLVFGFLLSASADPGVQNGDSLSLITPSGGAYIIVTELTSEHVTFNYGWNSLKHFEKVPSSTLLFVFKDGYSEVEDHRVYGLRESLPDPIPKPLKHNAVVNIVSGEYYEIHYYIYEGAARFIKLVLSFTAP